MKASPTSYMRFGQGAFVVGVMSLLPVFCSAYPAGADFKRVTARVPSDQVRPTYDMSTSYSEYMSLVSRCMTAIEKAQPFDGAGLIPAERTFGQEQASSVVYDEVGTNQMWVSALRTSSASVWIYYNIDGKPVTFCSVNSTKDFAPATGQRVFDTVSQWMAAEANARRTTEMEYPYRVPEKNRNIVHDSIHGNARGFGMQFHLKTIWFGDAEKVVFSIVDRRNTSCTLNAVKLGGGI